MTESVHLPFFLGALGAFLVVINPFTKAGLFLSLCSGTNDVEMRRRALRSAFYVWVLLMGILTVGNVLLTFFSISTSAMRVAGGSVIAAIGFRILFRDPMLLLTSTLRAGEDPSFFPIALPGIVGPSTLAVVFSFSTQWAELAGTAERLRAYAELSAATLLAVLCVWATMRFAVPILKRVTPSALAVGAKFCGFLMIAIGMQFVISGAVAFLAGN